MNFSLLVKERMENPDNAELIIKLTDLKLQAGKGEEFRGLSMRNDVNSYTHRHRTLMSYGWRLDYIDLCLANGMGTVFAFHLW